MLPLMSIQQFQHTKYKENRSVQLLEKIKPNIKTTRHQYTIKANDETFMLHTKSVIINLVVYRYENNPKHHKYIHTWSKPYTNTVTLFPHMHGRRINSQCFLSSTHTNFHSIVAAILAVIIPPSRYNLLFHPLCSLLLLVLLSFINC